MDNGRTSDLTNKKFSWKIEKFSTLSPKKLYSPIFTVGGYPWRILVFPNGNNMDYLSIYLDAADAARLPRGWSRNATFTLAIINQVDSKMTVKKVARHQFNARENDWGFTAFMPLSELRNLGSGYVVNDTCIIDAEVSIDKFGNPDQVDQANGITASQISGGQAGKMELEPPQQEDRGKDVNTVPPLSQQVKTDSLPSEVSSTPGGELVDFRGLWKIEKVFVQLLEEVCSKHPSLIECQRKRSHQFIEWAFTALGRVLHFLKTKRVKDMNEEACMDLKVLWEELETFKFDLTWLEPHVQSALGMKNYLERALRLKKLKENVDASETEMKKLKEKLAAAKVDLETARRDLMQALEGFEERDIDAELGYGRP
ncbi:MATH domain and coiled-coil domain-containing protein [Senna tora]|uniref:MATH domain and coiled-coil domain-containing protein n=1 Tax=Senna tora TaxID=362788 RepID=A0A834WD21_9FABA|nr:MATH domain and coiled-coil domain-containing protein [Senna tora]